MSDETADKSNSMPKERKIETDKDFTSIEGLLSLCLFECRDATLLMTSVCEMTTCNLLRMTIIEWIVHEKTYRPMAGQ